MPLQAILLAAGSSQRFTGNKLLRPLASSYCLLDICYRLATQLTDQVVVVIRDDTRLQKHCQQHQFPYLVNSQSLTGMASSIVTGVSATADADGWAICLADMPCIRPETMQRLASTWVTHGITVPVCNAKTGHPVIFSGKYRDALTSLRGDRGARELFRNSPDVYRMQTDDAGVCVDIDTDEDWENWSKKHSTKGYCAASILPDVD